MHEAEATTQAHESASSERVLLAHLRHELRTPLNAVIGYSELLLEEGGADEFAGSLRKMLSAGRELLTIVNELLVTTSHASQSINHLEGIIIADVRHQLRTSLTTVSGYCELLIEEVVEAGRGEMVGDLERILVAAEKFLTLIDSVFGLSARERAMHSASNQGLPVPEMIAEFAAASSALAADALEQLRSAAGSLLIVDDNEVNRDLLVRRLAREGHRLEVASNGRQALEMIEAGDFDLVLLDVIMPELNGYQVLEALKEKGRLRDLPVIMLSALGELDSVVQCISLGAEDYLPKPYEPVLLRARIGASLQKKRLRDRVRQQLQSLERELDLAAKIQQSILPQTFPVNEHVEVVAEMTPARAIGGDFYDFFQLDETRFGFAVADVSGKGAPAALFMALTRAFLKATAAAGISAGECLERVNQLVHAENHTGMFVTVFYGILDTRTGEVEFANAGHNHPYLLRLGKQPEMLDHYNSLVIGVMKGVTYPTHRLQLQPGEQLFLYTDGVTEAMNEALELFSEERLEKALEGAASRSPRETTRGVSMAVQEFANGAAQSDDLTMLLIKFL